MYTYVDYKITCSKCSSDDYEYVSYKGKSFYRCMKCKHEGSLIDVINDELYQSGDSYIRYFSLKFPDKIF